jgi:hypothetical protein
MTTMKQMHEYSKFEWAALWPEQRFAIKRAADDAAAGRNLIPTRAADGRGVVWIDPITKQPVAAPAAQRRIGG